MQYLLALEDLNAQPDQLLTYHFWADDIGPDGKTRRTSSDMYFVEIRHFEEVFRESQSFQDERSQNQRERQGGQQQGKPGEQLARLQKQIISATWNVKRQADQSGGVDDHKEDIDLVRQSQADALKQAQSALTEAEDPPAIKTLQEATKHMETAVEHLTEAVESASAVELTPALAAEQSAYQELLKLRDREHQVARARSLDRDSSTRSARYEQQLQQLELRQRENRYETERLAQSQEQATQREDLQVLNRLADLARRQSEVSNRLREAEAALQQAQNEQQRQEILGELKRLREEQLEALRDVDELQQRMERPGNGQRMANAREQLDQSRSRIRQSAEELEQGMVSRAITSTTRARRELEQMRDEFRRGTSSQFTEQMRNMRDQAQQLDRRERQIADEIRQQIGSQRKTLADSGVNLELADRIDQQKEGIEELIDQMKNVSEQAEASEPLLSRRLYDTLRRTSTQNVGRTLDATGELIRRNFLPQAQEIERQAARGIEDLRTGVEEAATSVLGDEAESLRLARQQLDELIRQVDDEVARASGRSQPAERLAGQRRPGDPNEPADLAANQQRIADAQSLTGRRVLGDPNAGGRADPAGWRGFEGETGPRDQIDPNGPLTGRDFRQWSDRLRDVQEMLNESDLRNEVARVRDRARAIRAEFTRHGKQPQWDLVNQQITKRLAELRNRISEELAQLQSDKAMVPIDRDPVPSRFAELVRRCLTVAGTATFILKNQSFLAQSDGFAALAAAPEISAVQRIAFCLRLLGVLVLILCLMEPLWIGRRATSGANLFVVVADNSSSMNVRDQGMTQSRGEILRAALASAPVAEATPATGAGVNRGFTAVGRGGDNWLGTLADSFQVRQYVFDSQLRRTTDFSELVFDGKASAISETLGTIAQRYRGRPVAGVLLMTDGGTTDMAESAVDRSDVPPVYPVVIGGSRPLKDISLTNVSVSQTSFEDAPVTIQADVEASGYAGKTVAVDLIGNSGEVVERQTRTISKNDEKQTFCFRLRPDKTGVLFYHLRAIETSTDASSEATLANNKRTLVVDRGKGPYRILYVTGRPNWEYKFLRRAISEDEQVQLVGLVRVAKREPKYDWRGHVGEQGNPLYRGFDNKDQEQTEQYDQPVLVRLNTRDEAELRDGFPKTAEELFGYHAVILDDIEAGFFSHDQMEILRRFVAERGGGFLMLGGKESFQQGKFDRTPIGRILPVYLDRLSQPEGPRFAGTQIITQVHLNLTREGWLQSWARLRDNEQDEQRRLLEMPAFRVLNRVRAIKPGASIVATAGNDPDKQSPALVVQRYGNGRTAALTVGDVWRWGMKQSQMRDDMNKFWRQTLRWLVADVPNRTSFQAAHKRDQVNQPVILQVRVRDKNFEPMDNVSVAIELDDPQGQKLQLSAEPVLSSPGLFEATYIPRSNGCYSARAVVSDANGLKLGDAETGWAVDLEAREFASVRTNRALLERIARQTGGQVIELDALGNFVRSLPSRDAPITETWIKPLWDLRGILPAIFLFVLMCFVGEWALRRWKGMP